MHENNTLQGHVTVIRADGAVLYSVLATESYSFGSDEDEAIRYAERVKKWLEKMPTADFDPEVFARKEFDGDALDGILNRMLIPEQQAAVIMRGG